VAGFFCSSGIKRKKAPHAGPFTLTLPGYSTGASEAQSGASQLVFSD
jgi:hypothetical protein